MAAQTTPAGATAAAQNVNAVPSPANAQHATGLMAKLNAQVAQASKEDYDDEFERQKQVTDGGNSNTNVGDRQSLVPHMSAAQELEYPV